MSDVTDQAAEVRELVAAAVAQRMFGVDYGFDVAWAPVAVQAPAGMQMVPCYFVLITRPGPLLGQVPLSHVGQVMSARPTAGQVSDLVAEGIRLLADLHARLKRPDQALPVALAAANGRHR
jgi:hypothetical protein